MRVVIVIPNPGGFVTRQQELRQEIDDANQRFFAALEEFDDTTLETQPICGVWSARDVAGHLADWDHEIVDAAERLVAGQEPKPRIPDIDQYNETQSALRGIESWEQTAEDLRAAWARTSEVLGRLSDEDLARIGQLPWGPVEPVERFFHILARHTREHVEEAESWRWRMLGVPERHE